MLRNQLVDFMVRLLQGTLAEHGSDQTIDASATSPLIGPDAILTSLGLVSFIADLESALAQEYRLELTLVSEQALSRRNSPFRTVETLADYVLEQVAAPMATLGAAHYN